MSREMISFVSCHPVPRREQRNISVDRRMRAFRTRRLRREPLRASTQPPSSPRAADRDSESVIPGTPCFTQRVMASPMPSEKRDIYLRAASAAVAAYLSNVQPDASKAPVAQITLLLPQLNPELDVYDRRFLLRLTWAVLDVTASSCRLRTRVLIQGTGAFGAVPLSVAGLRRHFDADLEMSREAWPDNVIRSGFLENPNDLDEEDEIIIVISPTNAVSIPVIDSLTEMVERARCRPVILLNPRLADVPSHSGVMQVSGRAERIQFLESIDDIFHLRLLFSAGTMYPLRGILYRAYPGPWQVWRAQEGDTTYRLISSTSERPRTEDITSSFAVDRYEQQKELMDTATASGTMTSVDSLIVSPAALAVIVIGTTLAVLRFFSTDIQQIAHTALWR